MRITNTDLNAVRDRINAELNQPLYYTNNHMFLDGAYGGWKLSQVMPTGSGARNITRSGYTTKRALYNEMHAFLLGIQAKPTSTSN
tara:strand:+ start:352 stop:609 length:258 start_codon:yes stop_codon:yes gene_type:complete